MVQGEVLLDGRPLESGAILFAPTGATRGPRAGGRVDNGRYEISESDGPVIGTLRVEIRSSVDLGYDITDPEQSVLHAREPLPPNLVPPRYNEHSTLVVETRADGDNTFDFHLRSRPLAR